MDSVVEENDVLVLPEDKAHHMQKVLRARTGDTFEVVDATQGLYIAELRDGRKANVLCELEVLGENPAELRLYQAVPKGKHMDFVVEKATELGVDCIVPLVSEHSVVRLDREGDKVGRWRRLSEAAARQSLQLRVPEVLEPVAFGEAVNNPAGSKILLANEPGVPPLEEVIGGGLTSLFVGPEGGWSEPEIQFAVENGSTVAQLGPYRLRSETAGVVAVARAVAAQERLHSK
ncbi:MAG: RsmE family RNA methyltransferase [Rubrobacteraceae bacterium]